MHDFIGIPVARLMPARLSPSLYQPSADQSTVKHLKFTIESIRPCRGGVGMDAAIPDGLPVKPGDSLMAEFPPDVNPLVGPYTAIYPASQNPKERPVKTFDYASLSLDLSTPEQPGKESTMNALTIANTAIRTDAEGRYCMNDLHRASGGEKRHQPSDWLRIAQTQELIRELSVPGNPGTEQNQALRVYQGGNFQGTYVVKELVYAYAMWISVAFHLKVIRAYDAMVTQHIAPVPAVPQTLPEALRLAADLAEQKALLEHKVEEQAPKVAALERIEAGKKSLTLTEAAKVIGIKRDDLIRRLHAEGWIYRQNCSWVAHSATIHAGRAEYKEAHFTNETTGQEEAKPYCHLTPKGLTQAAEMFA